MPVSLNNKRNTKMVERRVSTGEHSYRVAGVSLVHHGHTTCVIDYDARTIAIDTCGYDTVTTRGKINLFIRAKTCSGIALARHKGDTYLHRGWQGNTPIRQPFDGRDTVAF